MYLCITMRIVPYKCGYESGNETDVSHCETSHAQLCCLAAMAGGRRQQGGAVPLPEGAGATDLLPEEGVHSSGGRGAHAEPTPLPSGVLPVWGGSSGGSGEAQAGQHLLPTLRTCF